MARDRVDQLYDALKQDGAHGGMTSQEFRSYFLAPGKDGYYNRNNLFNALKKDGIIGDEAKDYNEFASLMGMHAVSKTPAARPAQRAQAGNSVQQTRQANQQAAGGAMKMGVIGGTAIMTPEQGQQAKQKAASNPLLQVPKPTNPKESYNPETENPSAYEFVEQMKDDMRKATRLPGTVNEDYNNDSEAGAPYKKGMRVDDTGTVYDPEERKKAFEAMSPEEKAIFIQNDLDLIKAEHQAQMDAINERAEYTRRYGEEFRKHLGKADLSFNDPFMPAGVYKGGIEINPETGKPEQVYLTEEGKTFNLTEAVIKQRALNQSRDEGIQKRRLHEQNAKDLEEVNQEIARREKELNARDEQYSGLSMSLMRSASEGGNAGMSYQANRNWSDPEMVMLMATADSHKKANKMIAEAGKNKFGTGWEQSGTAGVLRGLRDGAIDYSTWDSGMSNMAYATALSTALNKADKGLPLSKAEQMLLDAKAKEMVVSAFFSSDIGRGYKAGQVTSESLPFMLEMAINPAAGLGKGMTKQMIRYAFKKWGTNAAKDVIKRQAAKWGTRIAADYASAAAMTATTGMVQTAGNTMERMNGDVKYTQDEEGNYKYNGHTRGESFGTAFAKAFASGTFERYSEFVGGYFGPMFKGMKVAGKAAGGAIARGTEKVIGTKAGQAISKAGAKTAEVAGTVAEKTGLKTAGKAVASGADKVAEWTRLKDMGAWLASAPTGQWAKNVDKFMEKTQWHGPVGEYFEEVVNNMMSTMIGDKNWGTGKDGVFNVDDNIDTFLGVALMGGFVSTLKTVGYKGAAAEALERADRADRYAMRVFNNPSQWDRYRYTIATASDEDVKTLIANVMQDPDMTNEQKRAVANYAAMRQAYKGAKFGQEKAASENPEDARYAISDSYNQGWSLTNSAEMQHAQMVLQERAKNMEYLVGAERMQEFQADPIKAMNELFNEVDLVDSERQTVLDYVNAYTTVQAMNDRTQNDVASRQAQSDAEIAARTNKNGQLQPVELRDKRKVFVVDGEVALQQDSKTIDKEKTTKNLIVYDPQKGKTEYVSSDELFSVGLSVNADEAAATERERIAKEINDDRNKKAAGTLPFNPGDRVEIATKSGNVATILITGNNGDGTVRVSTNNGIDQSTVPMEQLQQMSDRASRMKVQQEEKERQDKAEQEELDRKQAELEAAAEAERKILAEQEAANKDLMDKFQQLSNELKDVEDLNDEQKAKAQELLNQASDGQLLQMREDLLSVIGCLGLYSEVDQELKNRGFQYNEETKEYEYVEDQDNPEDDSVSPGQVDYTPGTVYNVTIKGVPGTIEVVNDIDNDTFNASVNGGEAQVLPKALLEELVNGDQEQQQEGTEPAAAPGAPVESGAPAEVAAPAEPVEAAAAPMPLDGKGNPAWNQTTPERGLQWLENESGLEPAEIDEQIILQRDAARKALEKAKKNTPKQTTDIAKYKADKAAYQQKVEAAQAEVDYWETVKDMRDGKALTEQAARDEEQRKLTEQAKADEAARVAAEAAAQAAQQQRGPNTAGPEVTGKWNNAEKIEGASDEIVLPNGDKVEGHYVLVEAGTATPSHNPANGYAQSQDYPVDENGNSVNDRDYEGDKAAQEITQQIADHYDRRAIQSPVVVSQDGVVLSGNGRTMAGDIAAQQGTDADYIEYLKKYPQKFGFTPEQVENMEHPRVVFVPNETPEYSAETLSKYNQTDMKSQSKTESAVKLGKIVDDATFGRIIEIVNGFANLGDFYADAKASRDAIMELQKAGVFTQAQVAEMFDGDTLSPQGRELLENTLIGKAFEANPDAVRQISSNKAMRQSIVQALKEITNNVALKNGYSLETHLAQAIDLVHKARKHGWKAGAPVSMYASQGNLFVLDEGATAGNMDDATMLMLADILNDGRSTLLKQYLKAYNDRAKGPSNGELDMWRDGIATKEEIVNEVNQVINRNNGQGTDKQSGSQAGQNGGSTSREQAGSLAAGLEGRNGQQPQLIHNKAAEQLDNEAQQLLNDIAVQTGRNIKMMTPEDIAKATGRSLQAAQKIRGYYDYKTKTLVINTQFLKRPIEGTDPLMWIMGHELTHLIRKKNGRNSELWKNFVTAVVKAMGQEEFDARYAAAEKKYKNYYDYEALGEEGKRDVLIEEVVADWAGRNIASDTAAMQTVLDHANQAGVDTKSLIEKILAYIEKVLATLNGVAEKVGLSEDEKVMQANAELAKKIWEGIYQVHVSDNSNTGTGNKYSVETEQAVAVDQDGNTAMDVDAETGNIRFALAQETEVPQITVGRGKTQRKVTNKELRDEKIEAAYKAGKLTEDQAKYIRETMDEVAAMAKKHGKKSKEMAQWNDVLVDVGEDGKPIFTVMISDSEYPFNFGISLVCKKRRALDAVMREMVSSGLINQLARDPMNMVAINKIIKEHNLEVGCDLCYVEARRFRSIPNADKFTEAWNKMIDSLDPDNKFGRRHHNFGSNSMLTEADGKVKKGIEEATNKELDFTYIDEILKSYAEFKKENQRRKAAGLPELKRGNDQPGEVLARQAAFIKQNPEVRKLLDRGDFVDSEGFGTAHKTNPKILSMFNATFGFSNPKNSFGDRPYNGDFLTKIHPNSRKRVFKLGGVRFQSFDDYIGKNHLDYAAAFADLAVRRLPMHSYSKEELFLKLFGLMGKHNASMVPDAIDGAPAGLDKDGNYLWHQGAGVEIDRDGKKAIVIYDRQSANWEQVKAIRTAPGYREHVGSIAVGVSDEHIWKMMFDKDIDMIIPYHRSSLNKVIAHAMGGVGRFTDYTDSQTEKKLNDEGNWVSLSKEEQKKVPSINQLMALPEDGGKNMGAREAVEYYVRWCEKHNIRPKFVDFCYKREGDKLTGAEIVDENGVKQINDGYYKFIADFKIIAQNEQGEDYDVPQRAVDFALPTAEDSFGSYEDLSGQGVQEWEDVQGDIRREMPGIIQEIQDKIINGTMNDELYALSKANQKAFEAELKAGKINGAADGIKLSVADDVDDIEYMNAVGEGDMETAQRIIGNAAAKAMPDTVVVDENGKPKILYHGSPVFDIVSFDIARAGRQTNVYDPAVWFTDDQAQADIFSHLMLPGSTSFTVKLGPKGKVYPVYINMQNPFDMREILGNEELQQVFRSVLKDDNVNDRQFESYMRCLEYENHQTPKLFMDFEKLKALGYDGIIARMYNNDNQALEYGVFDPAQIKSAEPVTYDDDLQVIPASQRFNTETTDTRFSIDDDQDTEYADAVENGDMEKVSNMLAEKARANGYINSAEYQRGHTAPTNDGFSKPLHDVIGIYPDDVYGPNGLRYYGFEGELNRESWNIMRNVRNNPDAMVTIYRTVPANIKESEVRNGDWITTSRAYAESHRDNINGRTRIIEQQVPAKYIWTDGNSLSEYGYDDGKEYAYKNTKNGRKLFEPTYDDEGNLIPLSQRFNSRNSDVRYSIDEAETPNDVDKATAFVTGRDTNEVMQERKSREAEQEQQYQDDLERITLAADGGARFSIVDDPAEIERLDNEETIEAYHAMQMITMPDGKRYLFPPMAAVQDGNYVEGIPVNDDGTITPVWEKSDENPHLAFMRTSGNKGINVPTDAELEWKEEPVKKGSTETVSVPYYKGKKLSGNIIDNEDGKKEYEISWYFALKKGNTGDSGKKLTDLDHVLYDPYQHSGETPLNDQFTTAYDRSHLVIVKVRIPKSEAEGKSGYRADKAGLAVGMHEWKGGALETKKKRQVVLSRWDKPIEVLSDAEVAKSIKQILANNGIKDIMFNIVTPAQREELVKLGVKIGAPTADNAGQSKTCLEAYNAWCQENGVTPEWRLTKTQIKDCISGKKNINDIIKEQRKRGYTVVPTQVKEIRDGIKKRKAKEAAKAAKTDNIKFSIAGEKGAENLDRQDGGERIKNKSIAEEMERAGKDAKTIKIATGWERGADGKWRYELFDDIVAWHPLGDAEMRSQSWYKEYDKLFNKLMDGTISEAEQANLESIEEEHRTELLNKRDGIFLRDFIEAPELYKAYPFLRMIPVKKIYDPNGGFVASVTDKGVIVVNEGSLGFSIGDPKLHLAHEIQHLIQRIEGFARGGNSSLAIPVYNQLIDDKNEVNRLFAEANKIHESELKPLLDAVNKAEGPNGETTEESLKLFEQYEKLSEPVYAKAMAALNEFINKYKVDPYFFKNNIHVSNETLNILNPEEVREFVDFAHEYYKALAGEVEARNASQRLDMTSEERGAKPLLTDTEDVKRDRQIIRYDDVESTNEGPRKTKATTVINAVRYLSNHKNKWLDGVFDRMGVGNIGLFWGDKNKGVYHIIKKHVIEYADFDSIEDAFTKITDIINNGSYERGQGKQKSDIEFKKDGYIVVVTQMTNGNYVLTSYDASIPQKKKKRSEEDASRFDHSIFTEDGALVPQTSTSGSKVTENSGTVKENTEENAGNGKQDQSYSIADDIYSDNFKRWFGDWENDPENSSKVVNEDGTPKVVYHGSRNAGFTVFDTSLDRNAQNLGSHFGTKEAAKTILYTDDDNSKDIYAVYLDIKHPYIPSYEDFFTNEDQLYAHEAVILADKVNTPEAQRIKQEIIEKYPMTASEEIMSQWWEDDKPEESYTGDPWLVERFRKLLEMGGYDGIIYNNWYEDAGNDSYVVLSPEQVKSATGNNGEFDRNNPDIRYSVVTDEENADYLDAVNSGDTEKAQQMVDKAAEKAGYTINGYHGTHALEPFYVFMTDNGAAWISSSKSHADMYDDNKDSQSLFAKIQNPLYMGVIDNAVNDSKEITDVADKLGLDIVDLVERCCKEQFDEEVNGLMASGERTLPEARESAAMFMPVYMVSRSPEFAEMAKGLGYDGIRAREYNTSDEKIVDTFGVFSPEQIKSADAITYDDAGNVIPLNERFNEQEDDIRFAIDDEGPQGFEEILMQQVLDLANTHKENVQLRINAVSAIANRLERLRERLSYNIEQGNNERAATIVEEKLPNRENLSVRQGMAAQYKFDKATVNELVGMAKMFIRNGMLDNLGKLETIKLINILTGFVGRENIPVNPDESLAEDGTIRSEYTKLANAARNLIDLLVDHQQKTAVNFIEEAIKIRGSKINNVGVEVQGRLDARGKAFLDAFKEGKDRTVDELDTMIADAQDRMESDNEVKKRNAAMRYQGLLLAKVYVEEIKDNKNQQKEIRQSIQEKEEDLNERIAELEQQKEGATPERIAEINTQQQRQKQAYRDYVKNAEAQIFQLKLDRIKAAGRISAAIGSELSASIQAALEFQERERQRVAELQHASNSDTEGRPHEEQRIPTIPDRIANSSWIRMPFSPMANFVMMLRMLGSKAIKGEGYLYNYFMRKWVKATDAEWKAKKEAYKELGEKVKEVCGRGFKRWSDLYKITRKPGSLVNFYNGGKFRDHKLTQGNLMYIYMVAKMKDGMMKLNAMGMTEDDIARMSDALDPRLKKLADWIQDEFLPKRRDGYNEVYERLFGVPMPQIDNYFPLKILGNARKQNQDVNGAEQEKLPGTVTENIIKRKHNTLPLDILGTDAVSVVVEHMEKMENWAAFAELRRDMKDLLNYNTFMNKVKNMSSTLYGSGETLWKNLVDCFTIAAGQYRPSVAKNVFNKAFNNAAKMVTAAKIAFLPYTALKQLTSFPAYLSSANWHYLAASTINPVGAWRWAMKNLPTFDKRWESRQAGEYMLQSTESDWGWYRNQFIQKVGRLGMTPNAFVDALTVAMGARAIYWTKRKQYKALGYSAEEAEQRALEDAAISVNETQQSSEGAFMSPMQASRDTFSNLVAMFRNSPFGYTRQVMDAIRNLKHFMALGNAGERIEFRTKQLVRDGVDESVAKKAAIKEYAAAPAREAIRIAIFAYGLQVLWNIMPNLLYLLTGDDDDEKKAILDEAMTHAWWGAIEGLAFGNLISDTGNALVQGDGIENANFTLSPMASDILNIVKHSKTDRVQMYNDIVNLVIQAGVGMNPQAAENVVFAILDACEYQPKTAHEVAILIARIINMPQGGQRKVWIDEVGCYSDEAKLLSMQEIASRYAKYKVKRGAALTDWLYTEDERAEAEAKQFKVFEKEAKERWTKTGFENLDKKYEDLAEEMKPYQKKLDRIELLKHTRQYDEYEKQMEAYGNTNEYAKLITYKRFKTAINKLDNFAVYSKDPKEYAELTKESLEYKRELMKALKEIDEGKELTDDVIDALIKADPSLKNVYRPEPEPEPEVIYLEPEQDYSED